MDGSLPRAGFSVREVELLLGVAEKTGHRLINTGKLKAYTGVDGSRRVTEQELYLYMRDRDSK